MWTQSPSAVAEAGVSGGVGVLRSSIVSCYLISSPQIFWDLLGHMTLREVLYTKTFCLQHADLSAAAAAAVLDEKQGSSNRMLKL